MHCPLKEHWKCVKRILRYLNSTVTHGLLLQPTPKSTLSLEAFCDVDWGSDLEDRRSISGHCIFFGPNLIAWGSKKQTTILRSTTEVEYRSLVNTVDEIIWIQSLMCELHIIHAKTKHLELDLFFVREKVQRKDITVKHVKSHLQIADGLTKPYIQKT